MEDKQPTVMVVDDTAESLKLLERILHANGYRVMAFPGGARALKAAAKNPPDLILLDINMPEMNGFEVCERLKADDALKEIPVLFISGLTETADKVKAFSAGGVDYVTKPFQFEEVLARVKTHLELVRRKRKLKEAYDALRDLETLRDNLVHMIVHDMRSPLTVILGNLELAQNEGLPEETTDCINEARGSVRTLLEMVSSLLDVSKMESGKMTPAFASVDLRALVSETIRTVEPIKDRRSLTLRSPEKMEAVSCDARLIERVVLNLIGNAFKFTDKNTGVITVIIETAANGNVRVSVSDNGPGIPVECREKVFDKFFQMAARRQDQGYSTGLGLTFCKLAVEAHGGRIGVDGDAGGGSAFWFELPKHASGGAS